MSSLQARGRNRKVHTIPLPRMVRSQTIDSRSFQEVEAKKQKSQRSGSGQEVLLNILSVEVNGTGVTSDEEVGVGEKHKS